MACDALWDELGGEAEEAVGGGFFFELDFPAVVFVLDFEVGLEGDEDGGGEGDFRPGEEALGEVLAEERLAGASAQLLVQLAAG